MKKLLPAIRITTTLLLVIAAAPAGATDRVKANNATELNAPGSWNDGVVPTAADLVVLDSTLDGSFSSYAIGGSITNNGISFRDAASAQTITATANSTNMLANGSAGIAMTAAAINDFNLGCLVNLGTSGGQTFNVFDSARTLTMSGVISGTGPLTKTGNGILKLSANHLYTGGTVIAGGTLQLGSANTLGAGNVTVQSGATLDLRGFGLVGKDYVIHISGTGVGGAGALVDNAGAQLNLALTNLVLDADASVGGTIRFDMRPVGSGFPFVDLAGNTLTKVGANIFFLQELSSITDGNIVVQGGVLGVNGVPLTGNGLVTVSNAAELRIFRSASAVSSNTITRSLKFEAPALLNYTAAVKVDQIVASPITLVGAVSNSVLTAGAVLELGGVISGSGGIIKAGAGTLLLSGVSTNTGNTILSAGTLAMGTAWRGSGALAVNDGGTLEIRQAAQNATLNLKSLTNGSAAGPTTNTFNLSGFANPTSTVMRVTNALALNGTTIVNLSGTSGLTNGTFKLITFGSITGTGGFQIGQASGGNATLATNGNSIEVTFVPVTLSWRGETNGVALADWSAGLSTNWLNLQANTRAAYADGNGVLFNDSLIRSTNVNISAAVLPSSVTVSNVFTNYTFSGTGKISGTTSLTKTGAGTLILGLASDYSGATTISQGTLRLGIADALPTNSPSPAVILNGTLDLNGYNQTLNGLSGSGIVDNTTATFATLFLNGSSGGSIFAGLIQNTGADGSLKLAKIGGGTQALTGNNTFSGGVNINNGTLQLGSDNALGSGLFSIAFVATVSSDSTTARLITNSVSFGGANLMTLGHALNNGALTFSGPITLGGGNRTVAIESDVIFNGGVANGVNFTKQGSGKLTMNGVNTHSGNTTVSAGTLAGVGSFTGPVIIGGTATLSPGSSIGTMTIDTLSLNGTSTTIMELDAAGNTNDMVQGLSSLSYGGTLQVINLGGVFTNGQSFQLFSAMGTTGDFTVKNLPVLPGNLVWNWNPTSGTLSVVPPTATTPTNITYGVSGSILSLTWPGSYLGWIAQSNLVSVANTNFWFDIAGSGSATNLSISINPALPQVFYRLRLP
jgi:autotransporter-associated beta strand protein